MNEHGTHGRPIFQEQVFLVQQTETNADGHLKMLSQSEKHRYITTLGRVKENTTNIRKLHRAMQEYYDDITSPDSDYVFFLSGDLKYLATMNGHSGCASKFPCQCCVRTRAGMVSC